MEQVLASVIREALWMAILGLALGIGASFWLDRLIASMLYGLKTTDPLTMGGTASLLICVTLLAGLGPARRASRVDPLGALRHE
jgi:ABC-type antimicrobial peptide transport system permease subunit